MFVLCTVPRTGSCSRFCYTDVYPLGFCRLLQLWCCFIGVYQGKLLVTGDAVLILDCEKHHHAGALRTAYDLSTLHKHPSVGTVSAVVPRRGHHPLCVVGTAPWKDNCAGPREERDHPPSLSPLSYLRLPKMMFRSPLGGKLSPAEEWKRIQDPTSRGRELVLRGDAVDAAPTLTTEALRYDQTEARLLPSYLP